MTAESDGAGRRNDETLEGLFRSLTEQADARGKVSVGDLVDRLQHRSYGPVLLIPSAIAIFPVIGALPLVSYAMALAIFLIAIQAALSRHRLWLPERLRRMSFDRDAFARALDAARPAIRFVDRFVAPRFAIAFKSPWPTLVIWACAALGALMLVYAAVPGGVVIPGVALVLLSLGLTAHDGLLVSLGLAAAAAALAGSVGLVLWLL